MYVNTIFLIYGNFVQKNILVLFHSAQNMGTVFDFKYKKSGYLSHFLTIVYSKLHTCLLIVNQTLESILNLRFLVKPSPD